MKIDRETYDRLVEAAHGCGVRTVADAEIVVYRLLELLHVEVETPRTPEERIAGFVHAVRELVAVGALVDQWRLRELVRTHLGIEI